MTRNRDNVVLIAVNLDPHHAQSASFEVPLWELDLPDWAVVEVEDLFSGHKFTWHGKVQQSGSTPTSTPAPSGGSPRPASPAERVEPTERPART